MSLGRGSRVALNRRFDQTSRGVGTISGIIGTGEYCSVTWDNKATSTERLDHLVMAAGPVVTQIGAKQHA